MNTYDIEYKLSNDDVCRYSFKGKNKTDAIRNYTRETGCTRSTIISIEKINNF